MLNSIQPLSSKEIRSLEYSIANHGHAPFIGRETKYQHWFKVPSRIWQHSALINYLSQREAVNGLHRYDQAPMGWGGYKGITEYLNPNIPAEPDMELLHASGFSLQEYGNYQKAIFDYFQLLCEEPDIEGVHPICRRIVSYGPDLGTMIVNPERSAYMMRKNILQDEYKQAGRRLHLDFKEYFIWYKTRLSPNGTTPKQICIEGGPKYHKLIAHLRAIVNMLNEGWPVQHLLGIEQVWLRDKKARAYHKPYDQGGGPHPYYEGVYKVCKSSVMMRRGMNPRAILISMAEKLYPDDKERKYHIEEPDNLIQGITPMDFVTDIPTLQYCLEHMHNNSIFSEFKDSRYRRIW